MDLLYSDPALVDLYDRLNAGTDECRFYLSLIGPASQKILDLGCGTGRFAEMLAADGHDVIGVDPASAMLDIARRRSQARKVVWIEGDALAIPSGGDMDVVVMTGHAFQCLLTDQAVSEALAAVRRALRPGGRFMFESRNPLDKGWERWTPEMSRHSVTDRWGDAATVWHELVDVQRDLVMFQTEYDLAGQKLRNQSTLRFLSKDAIDAQLGAAGFSHIMHFGDWSGGAFEAGSREIIVIAA